MMQSSKATSITETVSVSADETKALLGVAAKNFVGLADGQNGVKLVSNEATIHADGSASVSIVYQQSEGAHASAPASAATVTAPVIAMPVIPNPVSSAA